MVKMMFDKPVKYNKVLYMTGKVLEVEDKHIDSLRKAGGIIVEGEKPKHEPILPSREALIERCEELNIEVGKKQDKTLLALIQKAEKDLEAEEE